MKLIFFDEAKESPDYPHYHLGAVCVDEAHLSAVEERITALSKEAFGSGELSVATEFHAAEIYHRKKNFKDWTDFNQRLHLIGQFAEILSLPEVQRIDIQINCAPLYAGQTPADIAFMFLCERANSLVKAQNALGMLIGDRESDRHAERFATTLSTYRANGTDFAFGQDIKNLVDSVHFTHSRAVFDLLKVEHINLFPSKYKEWPKL